VSVPFVAGAVIYAKNVPKVSALYAEVAGMRTTHTEQGYVVFESSGFHLVVVAIPAQLTASIHVGVPPERREDVPVKLVLPVTSIAAARLAAQLLGGQLNPPERE
jgi:hypothetical protein